MAPPSNQGVFSEKLANIESIVVELKGMIQQIDARLRAVEQNEIGCRAVNDSKLDAAHRRLDELTLRMEKIEKYLPLIQGLAWGAPAMGLMVLGLLWALFTHQATITFP